MKRIIFYLFVVAEFYPTRISAQTQSNVSYGTDALQKLDYYSAVNQNSPVIIIVHGGGWWTGDKNGPPYRNAAQLFNSEGYAVVNINYRLTPAVTFPSHISDLACALAWTKNNAGLFNGDSSRIAIFGHSAGGQMAAYLGTNPDSSLLSGCSHNSGLNVDAVFLTSATVDFDMTNPSARPAIINMLGDSVLYWETAQPINHAANNFDTKLLILAGDQDELGSDQDIAFNDSLNAYNHCSVLRLFQGEDHNSLLENLASTDTVFETMIAFLDSVWQGTVCPTTEINLNDKDLPGDFKLAQNYPNPFNSQTTIRYDLPVPTRVTISILDLKGRLIKTLVNQAEQTGYQSVVWDATDYSGKPVGTGVYLYRINSDTFLLSRKLVFLK